MFPRPLGSDGPDDAFSFNFPVTFGLAVTHSAYCCRLLLLLVSERMSYFSLWLYMFYDMGLVPRVCWD